jgi:S-adenosylmethionine/arginine decarboxylase-like enzyme
MPLGPSFWGKSVAISLQECEHDRLTNPELLKEFIAEVIKVVDMEAYGPCYVERFGEGNIEGYSAMQFITTSSITAHLDEVSNRAFIDIFSCKDFDADVAEQFAQKFFNATESSKVIIER